MKKNEPLNFDLEAGRRFNVTPSWNNRVMPDKQLKPSHDQSHHAETELAYNVQRRNPTSIIEGSQVSQRNQSQQMKVKGTQDDYRYLTLMNCAYAFVDNVGFQGVRYVFMRDANWFRRLIWILACLGASAYCCYVTIINVNNYYTYPTTKHEETKYTNELPFPAVTICNFNIFQKQLLSNEQALMLQDMYPPYEYFINETGRDPTRYDHVNMRELQINASFAYENNIGLCTYKDITCDSKLFSKKLRDIGVCTTFDPSQNSSTEYQVQPGLNGGLRASIRILDSEWSPGPFMNNEGMIVLVHDPSEETLLLKNHGIALSIGHTTNLVVSRKDKTLLPPPHGQCGTRELQYHSSYTESACRLECIARNLIAACNCREPYMPGNDSVRYCNNINLIHCRRTLLESGSTQDAVCDCPPECKSTEYKITTTSTKITNGTVQYVKDNFFGLDISTNGLVINAFYSEMSYEVETQEATYSVEKLLCDIGGAAGLFLGASFMSFLEVMDFITYVGWLLSVRYWKKSKDNKTSS